jgi:hypothetical protein
MRLNSFFKKGYRTWAVCRIGQDGASTRRRQRRATNVNESRSPRWLSFDILEARRVLDGSLPPIIDQAPTDVTANLVSSIPENQTNILLGTIDVVDPDGGFLLDFGSFDDVLKLTATPTGNELRYVGPDGFNFEESSSFVFEVRVFDIDIVEPVLTKSFTIAISDQNDPPLGLEFSGDLVVQEFVKGYEFGTITVFDQDVGESYNYQVSDSRFEVADGKLRLKSDASLRYNPSTPVSFEVVATGTVSGDVLREEFLVGVTLAPPPWQNKHWALDVNDDGSVTALDALIVINHMNRNGIGSADTPPPAGSATFVDVNGDRFITPLDVLIIINFLNQVQSPPSGSGSAEGEPVPASPPSQPTPPVPSSRIVSSEWSTSSNSVSFDSSDIASTKRRLVVS